MLWREEILEHLLYHEALLQLLPYLSKSFAENKRNEECPHDPITATLIIFLTCPVQLALTEVGAMLFQGHSFLVYPFNLMESRQRDFLRRCLERQQEWNIYNGAIVFRQPKGQGNLTLSSSSVLLAFCQKVIHAPQSQAGESSLSPSQRLAICNIILQRVQGYVQIEKQVQKELNEWLKGSADGQAAKREGSIKDAPEREAKKKAGRP